jgi:hypothetical protein
MIALAVARIRQSRSVKIMTRSLANTAYSLALAFALSRAGSAEKVGPATQLVEVAIVDPSLNNLKSHTVTIPSGWGFQGTVTAKVGCQSPSPAFRAYSPDGLTEIRLLPIFFWAVSKNEELAIGGDCIHLTNALTASQFLDRYAQTLGPVHVVGPSDVGPAYRKQLDGLIEQMDSTASQYPGLGITHTGDAAALRIDATNGTFTIELRLRARVICSLKSKRIVDSGICLARIDVLRAPKGELDALIDFVDSHNLANAKHEPEWAAAITQRIENDQIGRHFDPQHPNTGALAMIHRQADDFGLVRAEPHEAFMRTLGPARETECMPSDWTDFALAPKAQRTSDGVVSSPYTLFEWSNSTGERYATYNPTASPNGVLAGAWTNTARSAESCGR